MELYSFRGGARTGWLNATWPFARLRVGTDRLTLSCFGTYEFSSSQVVAIEPVGSIPILYSGIRIHHNRTDYPETIIFWCVGARGEVLDAITNSGFRGTATPSPQFLAGPAQANIQLRLRLALALALPLLGATISWHISVHKNADLDAALAHVNIHIPGSSSIVPFVHANTDPDIAAGDESFKQQDYSGAREHFEHALSNGDPVRRAQAETRVGYLLLYGLGSAADPAGGIQHLQTATELGDPYAEANLSWAYATGYGVRQDYAQALKWAAASAQQGITWSMHAIGGAYYAGWGVPRDMTRSRLWYQKSADFGDSGSQAQLAWFYLKGIGVDVDPSRAMILYQLSAEQGCALGERQLGWMYVHDRHDYVQGRFWYEKAARQGDAVAENNIGYLYENGLGVPLDYATAASWYTKSAQKGFVRARFHLGTLLVAGQGEPKDLERGRALIRGAADAGDEEAKVWLQKSPSPGTAP